MKALVIGILSIFLSIGFASAQNAAPEMTQEQMQEALKEFLTDDVVKFSQPLNNQIDFIINNYSEKDLKSLIKNYEKTARKLAKKQGKEYIPYDRRIDVNNPADVRRFLKRRIDMIF